MGKDSSVFYPIMAADHRHDGVECYIGFDHLLKMRSQALTIYEVTVSPVGSLNTVRQREPTVVYFSNLRKAVDAITGELALNGWPAKVNYTAVYRGVKERGHYSCDFEVGGTRVFRVKVLPKLLNPPLPRLGMDDNPGLAQ